MRNSNPTQKGITFLCVVSTGLLFLCQACTARIPCPLQWEDAAMGETPPGPIVLRSTVKQGDETLFFIGRLRNPNPPFNTVAGRIDPTTGFGYFPVSPTVGEISPSYQVLTNPNNCTLAWVDVIDADTELLAVEVVAGHHPSTYIGRGALHDLLVPGQIVGMEDDQKLHVANTNGSSTLLEDYTFLAAYSNGLNVQAVNFHFPNEAFAQINFDMIGIDQISNESPATAVQVLSHKKRVLERTVISSSSFSKKTSGFSIGLSTTFPVFGIPVTVGVGYNQQKTDGEEETNNSVHEEEREFIFTREIRVPPYSSVQACSLVSVLDDFKSQFTGELLYSAPGLGLDQVLEILVNEGITGGVKDEDRGVVTVTMEGDLEMNTAISTQFIVVPFDPHIPDEEAGCNTVAGKIWEIKQIRNNLGGKSATSENRVEELLRDINSIISTSLME